ncbi:hypothetical protein IJF81_02685 [bacterium]|nr:hypothetical protein [bacterium]
MTNTGITEGMGKKIVEALKQQISGEDVVESDTSANITMNMGESNANVEFVEPQIIPESNAYDMNAKEDTISQDSIQDLSSMASMALNQNIANFASKGNADLNDFDGLEIPTNVAVLKQLITQLPTGVTKQTGAQIIKQTMEALGISMKSVLQEAQQVQESLNNSARECQANIIESKRQIALLEKQTQKYQKQYAVLNDIISLFIQTNNY